MKRFRFADSYLQDHLGLEGELSPADEELLDQGLIAIVREPGDVPRIPSFYDPLRPSWISRLGPFLIHYSIDTAADEVVFLNLFRRP